MNIIIKNNAFEINEYAASMVAAYVHNNPQRVLVFPTGNTPLGLYKNLNGLVARKELSFSSSYLLELDEYLGIAAHDQRNLFQWLKRSFIDQVDFPEDHLYRFQADAADIDTETRRIEQVIKKHNGIGLLVLGIGPNGHLGFNEPGSPFDSRTRVIDLTRASLESSANYWGDISVVPTQGLTLGMQTLSEAQQTIMIVTGKHKADILYQMIKGEVTPDLPASFLRTMKNVTILADKDAVSML
ncbi:MAG: glucosamine-6-phosphate deaminase [Anaerolineaceae bacterium]|nr:glucosamine-6-phosphate deaminase [Anaerolineaceae bacterium]